jgi:hypothetical protein
MSAAGAPVRGGRFRGFLSVPCTVSLPSPCAATSQRTSWTSANDFPAPALKFVGDHNW